MTKKKVKPEQPSPAVPTYSVSHCSFVAEAAPANEHTRDAAVALARAAEANANAIGRIADALKGGNATMETGLRIGG